LTRYGGDASTDVVVEPVHERQALFALGIDGARTSVDPEETSGMWRQ